MTNSKIKQLAIASYSDNNLNEKKVNRIAKILTKQDLRKFIKALKIIKNKNTVSVFTAGQNNKIIEQEFKRLFPDKNVNIYQDKSLIAGIKIINNDFVYESSIKSNLNNIIKYISQ